jgi:hypothetical protein
MRGPPGWKYKYRPQHIIYDELCMVIQKRAFRLTEEEAIEIPLSMCRRSAVTPFTYVIVREIAFGPDSDPTVRGVALWFGISDDDVTVCTPQQAKRFRWKRPLRSRSNTPSPTGNMKSNKTSPMSFDTKDCFFMTRPYDTDAYNLVSGMLYHRLGVLRTKRIPQQMMTDRSVALETLTKHDAQLRNLFEHLVQYWTTWAWPVNEGRDHVDANTPAPPIDSKYWHHGAPDTGSDDDLSSLGTSSDSIVKRIWESFVAAGFGDAQQKNPSDDDETASTKGAGSKRRLAVFEALSGGASLSDDR